MSYAIYLNDIRMPVNPEVMNFKVGRSIKNYEVIGLGKISRAESRDLQEWTWSSEFPDQDYLYCTNWREPQYFIQHIQELLKMKEPCKFVVSNDSSGFSYHVLIKSFSYQEVQQGSYEYSIDLVEYVESEIQATGVPAIKRPGIIPTKPVKKELIRPTLPKPPKDSNFDKITAFHERNRPVLMADDDLKPRTNQAVTPPNSFVTIYPPFSMQAKIANGSYSFLQQKQTTETMRKASNSFMAMKSIE